ncbi:MAG: hypothetical protein P4M11_10095, partial [Candidatus Pacebacteria bacterium]|nr:hypothetical protein [Candidatus Paceibacterota bacterium]
KTPKPQNPKTPRPLHCDSRNVRRSFVSERTSSELSLLLDLELYSALVSPPHDVVLSDYSAYSQNTTIVPLKLTPAPTWYLVRTATVPLLFIYPSVLSRSYQQLASQTRQHTLFPGYGDVDLLVLERVLGTETEVAEPSLSGVEELCSHGLGRLPDLGVLPAKSNCDYSCVAAAQPLPA